MSALSRYIGTSISIITRANIRYSGTLYALDHDAKTVSIENVKMHGTENRNNSIREIPPSQTVYELVVFKAADIIELKVDEEVLPNSQDSATIPPSQSTDDRPAVERPHDKISPVDRLRDPTTVPTKMATTSSGKQTIPLRNNVVDAKPTMAESSEGGDETVSLSGSLSSISLIDAAPSTYKFELKPARTYSSTSTFVVKKTSHVPRHKANSHGEHDTQRMGFPRDFDLDLANRRFEDIIARGDVAAVAHSSHYDSSASFFDQLSSGTIVAEKQEKREIHLNVETFGPLAYKVKPSYVTSSKGRGGKGRRQYRLNHKAST